MSESGAPTTIAPALLAAAEERVSVVRQRVLHACGRAGRNPSAVRIVGACKRQPLERVAAAVCAGVSVLGENYVQECRDKQAPLADLLTSHFGDAPAPAPQWRLIGNLQRNKAKLAVGIFAAVDTVDRLELARELDKRAASHDVRLDVCIQVNLSGEEQKSGLPEAELPPLLLACQSLQHIRLVGLMTMPAAAEPEAARPIFARLRELRDTLSRQPGGSGLHELNMGMSADFDVAIEEGATLVRVGTALFGSREAKSTG